MLEEPSVEVLDTACALPGALRRSSGLLRSVTLDPRRLFASVSQVCWLQLLMCVLPTIVCCAGSP